MLNGLTLILRMPHHHFFKLLSPLVLLISELKHPNNKNCETSTNRISSSAAYFQDDVPEPRQPPSELKSENKNEDYPVYYTPQNQKILEDMVFFEDY